MSAFSATDAAFEGFRLTRERPRTVLVWATLCFLVSVCSAIYLTTVGRDASALLEAGPAETPDAAALGEMLAVLFPMMIMGLLFQCLMAAAVYRVTLRPEDRGLAYLKFSMDEVRLILLSVVYFFLVLGALIGAVLAAGIVAGLVMLLAGQGAGALMGVVIEFCILGVLF